MKRALALILSLVMLFTSLGAFGITSFAKTYKSEDGEFKISATEMKLPTMLKKGASFTIGGKLKSKEKIMKLTLEIYDLNQFYNNDKVTDHPEKKSVKLGDYASRLHFSSLSSGEKKLIITAFNEDGNSVLVERRFTVLGKAKEPRHFTNLCKFKASRGDCKNVTDKSDDTYWSCGKMTIDIPENKTVDGLLIKWHYVDNNYTLTSYSADGKKLNKYDGSGYKFLHKYYKLSEDTAKVVIRLKWQKGNHGIVSLRVYEKDKVGVSVEQWKAPQKGECDLMVVSAHRDDELLFFGGTIPYYQQVRGKNVYVMYLSGADRLRQREALAGQWALGNNICPIFMNFKGGYHDGISGTLKDWGGENYVLSNLVEKIRRYQPKVIVTHSVGGEYGHPTHKTAAYIIKKAVKAAGDKTKFKSSYKQYGAWKVKKLYLHVYPKNKVHMKKYSKKSALIDGKTPYQLACIGYDKHISQHGRWSMDRAVVKKYPSDRYGLVYTRVGYDKKKNDLFENID